MKTMKPRNALCIALAVAIALGTTSAWAAEGWDTSAMPQPGVVAAGRAPIAEALGQIVPPPYKVMLDQRIPAGTVVAWQSGSNWMEVLRNAVAPMGFAVQPNWQTSTIVVREATAPATAVAPLTAAAPSSTSTSPRPFGPVTNVTAIAAPPATAVKTTLHAAPYTLPHPTTPVPPLSSLTSEKPAAAVTSRASVETFGTNGKHGETFDFSFGSPAGVDQVGSAFTLQPGHRLSDDLSEYAARFGWHLQWDLPMNEVVEIPFPIPAMSLKNGLLYVLKAYQARKGLTGAVFTMAVPGHTAAFHEASAQEGNQ